MNKKFASSIITKFSGLSLSQASITLTSAQVKSLKTTPQVLVPAPGTGLFIIPLQAEAQLNYGGSNPFTNPGFGQLNIVYKHGAPVSRTVFETLSSTQMTATSNQIGMGVSNNIFSSSSQLANAELVVVNSSGTDFGGNAAGDNTIDVNIWYLIVTP